MARWRVMGLYLYCIGDPGHPAPEAGLKGVDGAAVRAVDAAGLRAWVSTHARAPGASLAAVREHNAVVESACRDRTALPVRFGQWFPDDAGLEELVREQRDPLERGLARVAGAMEMGVRVVDPAGEDAPPDRSTGRAYLEALARRESRTREGAERGAAVARALREWLGGLVREERVRPLGTGGGLVAVAHLVARHDIGGYNARAREFAPRHPELRFHFTGPWPPYGFADEPGTEGG